MKKTLFSVLGLSLLSLSLVNCRHTPGEIVLPAPHWTAADAAQTESAPVWSVKPEYIDLSSTMNIIAAASQDMSEGDQLAAFAGKECVGAAAPVSTTYGLRFYLCIYNPVSPSNVLTLAYYSHQKQTITYWPGIVNFEHDGVFGLAANPFTLDMASGSPYQYTLTIVYSMPKDMVLTDEDELALFKGDECRMVLPLSPSQPEQEYDVIIPISIPDKEEMYFRYYSKKNNKIYTSAKYEFAPNDVILPIKPIQFE